MKIAIIGAGFTGLTAALRLAIAGHQVEIFEMQSAPGGLAIGFKQDNWQWSLEEHYHHLFTSDSAIRKLAVEVNHPILFSRPTTSTLIADRSYQLDSVLSLLHFPHLSLTSKLRTGFGLALLKFNPFWRLFENITARDLIKSVMGDQSWEILWRPMFEKKFHEFSDQISAVWFWARIYKRSPSLGYPQGGFLSFAKSIERTAIKYGAKFHYNHPIGHVNELLSHYDKVICTLPTPLFEKISGLSYPTLTGLGAVNLVLSLKHQFLSDGTYWLNVLDRQFPFLAVVEHTNFISPGHYGGNHILYIGNYLPPSHPHFKTTAKRLVTEFSPFLSRISPEFSPGWVKDAWLFKAPFAQPIIPPRYSQFVPPQTTPIPNLFLANIQQVYPWDRGTNYAVELGDKVARLCFQN